MSAKAAMARRKQRAAMSQQQMRQQPQQTQQAAVRQPTQNTEVPVTSSLPQGKFNVNQFMIFLNNKIENIDNRVSNQINVLTEKIEKEIKDLKSKDVGHNIDLLEQTVETQKLKIAKLNSFINDLQSNYLVLNTSLMCVQNNLKPSTKNVGTESDHSELLKHDLKSVPIMEDEEEDEDDEEVDNEEFQEPEIEPVMDNNENMLMSINEK